MSEKMPNLDALKKARRSLPRAAKIGESGSRQAYDIVSLMGTDQSEEHSIDSPPRAKRPKLTKTSSKQLEETVFYDENDNANSEGSLVIEASTTSGRGKRILSSFLNIFSPNPLSTGFVTAKIGSSGESTPGPVLAESASNHLQLSVQTSPSPKPNLRKRASPAKKIPATPVAPQPENRPQPHGKPLVWAEVCKITNTHLT